MSVLNGVKFRKRPYIFGQASAAAPQGAGGGKDNTRHRAKSKGKTMRAIKVILVLAVLGFAGLVGYAYLGDLTPPTAAVSQPVALPGAGNGN